MVGGYEFKTASGGKFFVKPPDVRRYAAEFEGVDVDSVMRRAANKSRNLNLVGLQVFDRWLRAEFAAARERLGGKGYPAPNDRRPPAGGGNGDDDEGGPREIEIESAPPVAPAAAPEPKRVERHAGRDVELFVSKRDGLRVMISTSAATPSDFLAGLAATLTDAIYTEPENVETLILETLKSALQLGIRMAGYKVDGVREERVLIAGHVPPDECHCVDDETPPPSPARNP